MENSSGAPQNLMSDGALGRSDKLSRLLSVWFERIAMVGIVGIIIATLIDVIGAKMFSKPLSAGTEVVYFLQVVAIAGALAATKIDGKHIRLEFVDSFPRRIKYLFNFLVAVLGLGLFLLLAWQSFEYAQTLRIAKEVTAASRIPLYPFVLWIALCCIPLCLVLLQEMVKSAIEVKRFGYKDWVSTGTVATAGGLGIMIPPSTSFIVYGLLTEQSIGKLFIAGIIPGIILAALFMATVYYICRRDLSSGGAVGQASTFKQKLISLKGLTDTIILFGITIGGLFGGWFTPTQAGAIGAAGALIIGLINRELTWQKFVEATKDGLRLSCMIMLLIAGATVFGHFITRTGMPVVLADWVGTLNVSPTIIMLLIIAVWFVLGCFIDAMAIIVLLVPILLPVLTNLGIDLIWFAVIVTVLSMIAVVTPPVGVNAYVVKGITKDVPLTTIFRGILPFLIPFIVGTALLIAFPGLSTFLPTIITY